MKTKHTIGPWKIDYDEDGIVITSGFDQVCIIHTDNDADAKLIASAPKLLEALQELLENACDRDETENEETGEIYDEWKKAIDAINEATL